MILSIMIMIVQTAILIHRKNYILFSIGVGEEYGFIMLEKTILGR